MPSEEGIEEEREGGREEEEEEGRWTALLGLNPLALVLIDETISLIILLLITYNQKISN